MILKPYKNGYASANFNKVIVVNNHNVQVPQEILNIKVQDEKNIVYTLGELFSLLQSEIKENKEQINALDILSNERYNAIKGAILALNEKITTKGI